MIDSVGISIALPLVVAGQTWAGSKIEEDECHVWRGATVGLLVGITYESSSSDGSAPL
jgi:hypothetical protein